MRTSLKTTYCEGSLLKKDRFIIIIVIIVIFGVVVVVIIIINYYNYAFYCVDYRFMIY